MKIIQLNLFYLLSFVNAVHYKHKQGVVAFMITYLTFTARINTETLDYQTYDPDFSETLRAKVMVESRQRDGAQSDEMKIVDWIEFWNEDTRVNHDINEFSELDRQMIIYEILKQAKEREGEFE